MFGRQLSNKKYQLDALDGLRGLAVLIVILAHTSNLGYHIIPFADFSGAGHSGVFLFFVLSSFLLTYQFIARGKIAFTVINLGVYFERRFFRIYPLYFLYLTMGLVSTYVIALFVAGKPIGIPFALSLSEYVDHLLMIYGKEVTWSIPVEFKYYFLLPVIAYVMVIILNRGFFTSFVFVLVAIYAVNHFWPLTEAQSVRSIIYHLPVFLCGSLLAVTHHAWIECGGADNKVISRLVDALGLVSILLIVLLTPAILEIIGFNSQELKPHKMFLAFSVLWAVVIFAAIHGEGALRRVFENKALRFLGFVSFSAYLFHPIFIKVVEHSALGKILPSALSGWFVLVCTLLTAWLSFVFIERPASRLSLSSHFLKNSTK
jgi:peptidoglycan/LPS O-acetylase OafA/YrhL